MLDRVPNYQPSALSEHVCLVLDLFTITTQAKTPVSGPWFEPVPQTSALLPHLDHEETEVMPRVMRALTACDWSLKSRREFRNWNSLTLAGTGLVWMADGLEHTERVKFNQQVSTVVQWLVDKRYGVAYRRRTALAFGLP